MKLFYSLCILGLLIIGVFSCSSKTAKEGSAVSLTDSIGITAMVFDEMSFNFGEISAGEIVEHTFHFTNTGDENLIIQDVQAACGCTTPDYTKDFIKPGEKGKITVKFDSSNREGNQSKTVGVYANTKPELHTLHFTAVVKNSNLK